MQDDKEQEPYVLLGDTYADIMYARQLMNDIGNTKDTSAYESDLIMLDRQIEGIIDSLDDLDVKSVMEEASQMAESVTSIIHDLEQIR